MDINLDTAFKRAGDVTRNLDFATGAIVGGAFVGGALVLWGAIKVAPYIESAAAEISNMASDVATFIGSLAASAKPEPEATVTEVFPFKKRNLNEDELDTPAFLRRQQAQTPQQAPEQNDAHAFVDDAVPI